MAAGQRPPKQEAAKGRKLKPRGALNGPCLVTLLASFWIKAKGLSTVSRPLTIDISLISMIISERYRRLTGSQTVGEAGVPISALLLLTLRPQHVTRLLGSEMRLQCMLSH